MPPGWLGRHFRIVASAPRPSDTGYCLLHRRPQGVLEAMHDFKEKIRVSLERGRSMYYELAALGNFFILSVLTDFLAESHSSFCTCLLPSEFLASPAAQLMANALGSEVSEKEPALSLLPLHHSPAAVPGTCRAGLVLSFIVCGHILSLTPSHISFCPALPSVRCPSILLLHLAPCGTILEMHQLSHASMGVFHAETHPFPQGPASHIVI